MTKLFILKSFKCFHSLAQFPVVNDSYLPSSWLLKTGIPNSMSLSTFLKLAFLSGQLQPRPWTWHKQGSNLPYPIGTRLPIPIVSFLSWILESLQFESVQYLCLPCLIVFQPLLVLVFLEEIYPVLELGYTFLVLSLFSICLWHELEQRASVIWKFAWVVLTSYCTSCHRLI